MMDNTEKLLVAPHNGHNITLRLLKPKPIEKLFNNFSTNFSSCSDKHNINGSQVIFGPPIIYKSISAVFYGFENPRIFNVKEDILDPSYLKLGKITLTPDGLFTNLLETDESIINLDLSHKTKLEGIYPINKDIVFIPYEIFKKGTQNKQDFLKGGLAKGLEHTIFNLNGPQKFEKVLNQYNNIHTIGINPVENPKQRDLYICSYGKDLVIEAHNYTAKPYYTFEEVKSNKAKKSFIG